MVEAGTPENEKVLQVARRAAQRGAESFQADREKLEGGKIGDWFGTKHQTSNILAIISLSLVFMIILSIAGSIYWNNMEFFKVIGVALLSTLTTIIGYLAGSRRLN